MEKRILILIILMAMAMVTIFAQQGQNQPIYDPNDVIGRVLPPNMYFLVDISGSMAWKPSCPGNYGCYPYDWGGQWSGSKISIAKNAIQNLMQRDSLRIRWSFWTYTNSYTGTKASNIDQNYNYFPTNLFGYDNHWHWFDTYVLSGSGCSSKVDRLLVPIFHSSPSDDHQWFKSSVDPGYDNRSNIIAWVDKDFDRTTGTIDVGWSWPFLKEIGARGSTPISYSLQSILRYTNGKNINGSNHKCYYFDFDNTHTYTNWNDLEKDVDPYYDCRYNAVLLLTDGVDTCAGYNAAVQAAGILHSNYKIDTYVVGFGLQGAGEIANLNNLAVHGGTEHAYFADNESDIADALQDILGKIGSEISGDTEPILGFVKPDAISWPVTMPNDVKLQNVVLNASTTYTPVFKGHLRCFQALTTSSVTDKINFLTDFSKDSPYLLWDAVDYLDAISESQRHIYTAVGRDTIEFSTSNRQTLKQMTGLTNLSNTDFDKFIKYIRKQTLGAVTYSTPAFAGPPDLDSYPSAEYQNWAKSLKDRTPMVLLGANDGMLHCFSALDGHELWAFIPPTFLEGTHSKPAKLYRELYAEGDVNSQGQPDIYGKRIYNRRPHYYYVASSPKVIDIRDSNGTWKTVCVFGLGAGGREYYCLDITDENNPRFMWRFDGDTNYPLGETWSVPALGRFAPVTASYPQGRFVAVFGSGFNLNPDNPHPQTIGKSLYLVDIATGDKIARFSINDTTQTEFGATPYDLVTQVGNCIFTPPVLFDSPSSADGLIDKIYFGDYLGNIYRIEVDQKNPSDSQMSKIFRDLYGTPIYSAPYVAEIYIPGIGTKTLVAFSEYGSPIDSNYGTRIPGIFYCLVEENLSGGTTQASELVQSTGDSSSFNPQTSKGFYFILPSPGEGESAPFRPTLFWQDNMFWMGATSYLYFPHSSGVECDPESHTVGAGMSRAYIFNLKNGKYFNQTPIDLGSGSSFYGRASAFHKGARGEGWIDVGTGEIWGWGYSKVNNRFEKFSSAAQNTEYEKNPTSGIVVKSSYWREFK